jgi:DNA-directed RNA polymerase
MIEISSGVMLPIPQGKVKGMSRPYNMNGTRWAEEKPKAWRRAYLHCLYTLPLHFGLPLHSVVPRMARKMLEATDAFNVALRFMGEMEIAGYIVLERGFDERVVTPTKKFLKLKLDCERAPATAIAYPKVTGEKIPRAPIRGGVGDKANRDVSAITSDMSGEEFEINHFMYDLIGKYPPTFDKTSSAFMYHRAMDSAKLMIQEKFRFPYFLDSRSRMYTDTTCGFSPQGADHEKALVIPTYKEALTEAGFCALLEAAAGYSEKSWSAEEMAEMARDPEKYEDDWKEADKPYCYMACADLIRKYLDCPSTPLPSFIPLDGRCSGLQHWSAVVRSNAITRHLGMHEDEHELDIYEKVASDWESTLDTKFSYLATRKAAKIPVMTWAYNATMMTSMEHMSKLFGAKSTWCDLELKYIQGDEGLDRATTSKYGCELYRQLQSTLGALQAAVSWVSDCAVAISKYGNVEIRWPTPDGFTCLQRKVKGEKIDLDCKLSDGSRFTLDILDFTGNIPNTGKHKSAIAPNVIHSLDATHLRMVARRLKELGLPMIFIHDSFATHCNYRDVLYKIIIETFVELYSMNYLTELKRYWEDLYGVELDDHPEMGDWEPASLYNLDRFFV